MIMPVTARWSDQTQNLESGFKFEAVTVTVTQSPAAVLTHRAGLEAPPGPRRRPPQRRPQPAGQARAGRRGLTGWQLAVRRSMAVTVTFHGTGRGSPSHWNDSDRHWQCQGLSGPRSPDAARAAPTRAINSNLISAGKARGPGGADSEAGRRAAAAAAGPGLAAGSGPGPGPPGQPLSR
jgi:hypothetical protein